MATVLPFDFMAEGFKRLTIDLPEDLHEAFLRKCFNAKPRTTMKEQVIAFIAEQTGKPMPKLIDRRKLTLAERDKLRRK